MPHPRGDRPSELFQENREVTREQYLRADPEPRERSYDLLQRGDVELRFDLNLSFFDQGDRSGNTGSGSLSAGYSFHDDFQLGPVLRLSGRRTEDSRGEDGSFVDKSTSFGLGVRAVYNLPAGRHYHPYLQASLGMSLFDVQSDIPPPDGTEDTSLGPFFELGLGTRYFASKSTLFFGELRYEFEGIDDSLGGSRSGFGIAAGLGFVF